MVSGQSRPPHHCTPATLTAAASEQKIREALVEYLRVNFTSTASGCYVVATIDNFSEIHWNTFNARLHIDSAVSQSIGERHDDEGG